MDEERMIIEFERAPGQKVVVRRTQFRGKAYLDLRQLFEGNDGQWLPTKKGVSLPWELRTALIEALQREEA
ncbi:MAG TPA: transcriptional Coactivator p15 (PC4) [Candidatus Acetothermia bacterium]|nr:transcriptional Coactivator p15 (PC4) [Candidatus Acetothermia bacterium]